MNSKTKLIISLLVLLLTVVSLLPTVWAMPDTQGTIPTRTPSMTPPPPEKKFIPTDSVFLSFVVYDSWVPPWWVPHILRSK